jgi:hypothetical protein
VRILDTILGRSKPVEANLDDLFALPSAAVTLEAAEGLHSSGQAGVCFKPGAGQPFDDIEKEIEALLGPDGDSPGSTYREEADNYGFRWMVIDDSDLQSLVTKVHMVNSTLKDHGYGPQLLCSVFGFSKDASSSIYLVYLFKRGSFYPFMPVGEERRDNPGELRLKAVVADDLRIEDDLQRWFPLWGLPLR